MGDVICCKAEKDGCEDCHHAIPHNKKESCGVLCKRWSDFRLGFILTCVLVDSDQGKAAIERMGL